MSSVYGLWHFGFILRAFAANRRIYQVGLKLYLSKNWLV